MTYPHPIVEQVLAKTLGVPLFQEQVMRLADCRGGLHTGRSGSIAAINGGLEAQGHDRQVS